MQGYNQERLVSIKNDNILKSSFDTSKERMIAILMYSKSVQMANNVKLHLEKLAEVNTISSFFILDIDEYKGSANIRSAPVPSIDFYYAGTKIASCSGTNYVELENTIRSCQQHVITAMNSKNTLDSKMQQPIAPVMQQPPITQMHQSPIAPTMHQPIAPQFPPQYSPVYQQHAYPTQPQPQMSTHDSFANSLPSMQQMQQMFQIFQMMQQMGVLNTEVKVTNKGDEDEILLPDGRRIVPLSNGKYGVIKKS